LRVDLFRLITGSLDNRGKPQPLHGVNHWSMKTPAAKPEAHQPHIDQSAIS